MCVCVCVCVFLPTKSGRLWQTTEKQTDPFMNDSKSQVSPPSLGQEPEGGQDVKQGTDQFGVKFFWSLVS